MKKGIVTGVLSFFLAVSLLPNQVMVANVMGEKQASVDAVSDEEPTMTEEEMANDPAFERETKDAPEDFFGDEELVESRQTTIKYNNGNYVHNTKFDQDNIVNGVDVSFYQGNINWAAAKADGIDFAFIRVGYRGSKDGAIYEDAYFKNNIIGALNANMQVGVYITSQAVSEAEAAEEARYVMERIKNYKVTLPVVIDYEYDANKTGRLYTAKLSKDKATQICNAFSNTVQAAGYQTAVYANKNMLENAMVPAGLNAQVWLAHYVTETSYTGNYKYWQYTNKGTVSGITGQVDMDFWYDDGIRNYDENLPVKDISAVRYYNADGTVKKDQFYCDGVYTYFLQSDGSPMVNRLTYDQEGTGLIYFDENGHMLFDTFKYCKDVGYTCYFNTYGRAIFDQVIFYHNKAYYMDATGKMQANGWFQYANGIDYGFAKSDGSLQTGGFGFDGAGRIVYYHWNGMVARGLINDGTTYYLMDEKDGHLIGSFR